MPSLADLQSKSAPFEVTIGHGIKVKGKYKLFPKFKSLSAFSNEIDLLKIKTEKATADQKALIDRNAEEEEFEDVKKRMTTLEQKGNELNMSMFAETVESWDITDAKGDPIPVTKEAVIEHDLELVAVAIMGKIQELNKEDDAKEGEPKKSRATSPTT